MKKIAALIVTISIISLATPVKAQPDISWGGTYYSYTFFWQNQDFNKDTKDGDNFTYLHGHLHALADFGGGVKTFIKVGAWGEFGTHPVWGTNLDGGADPKVGILEVYVELNNIFNTPLSLKIGKFNQLYGDGAVLFDGGEDGILGVKANLNVGPVSLDLLYDRLAEAGGIEQVGAMPSQIAPDLNFMGGYMTISLMENKIAISPYGFMRKEGVDKPMWIGGRAELSPVEFANATVEFIQMAGKDDTDVEYKGRHLLAKLGLSIPEMPVSLGGAYVMFSGDDPATPENELYQSAAENPYTFGFYKWWPGLGPAHLMTTGYGFGCVAAWNPTMVNLNVINGYIGASFESTDLRVDFFNYSRNLVPSGTDKALGNEIALHIHHSYKGLIDIGAALGYWIPGDGLKTELALGDNASGLFGGFVYIFKSF
ncbi:MAG: hypothetical protein QMD82_04080 [bacterium]|nr:hypothetical protein [bacterium]